MRSTPRLVSTLPQTPRRGAPVWLPWVAAPAFLLLPIGGCGVAASLRHPRQVAALPTGRGHHVAPQLVPVVGVVTALPQLR